tara:strand:+ start:32 stop:214 length:183 start_codon:yes stop_codon:yes gene_type:complete
MASREALRENLIYKFFQNWKNRRLNKAAEKLVRDNPGLAKALKKWDDAAGEVERELRRKR